MAIKLSDQEQLDLGYSRLIDTIAGKKFHPNYSRVTDLASLYSKLISGKDIDTLLTQFVRREDEAMFEQRRRVTQAITPAIASSIMNPFYKVGRVNNITKRIVIKDGKDEEQIKIVQDGIDKYNGENSLDKYLQTRFVNISFTDPNAFIITEFDEVPKGPQGEMLEKVSPRPFEVSSNQAVNFHYENNILEWLIVRLDVAYKKTIVDPKDEAKILTPNEHGYSYTIYLNDYAIRFTQVDGEYGSSVNIGIGQYAEVAHMDVLGNSITKTYYRLDEKNAYLVEEFNHKAGKVPAIRVGYRTDLVTNDATYVSPLHDALCYFMKSIKTVSEFDLTMCLHAFPQKFQYFPRCEGTATITCNSGSTPDGAKCSKCNGTGTMTHTSTQDVIGLRLPKDLTTIGDLSKFVHYERPPIDILEFQDKNIRQISDDARKAVFNSEIFSKTELVATATELRINMDSVYDTLFPFASRFSEVYKQIVSLIATFKDVQDVTVIHKFPKDFKFKTAAELLTEYKTATESSAPSYVRQEIGMDIAAQLFVDKPEELHKIKIKQKFFPFPDKTPTEVVYVISNGLTTENNKILWANFDLIFNEIEAENINFYSMPFDKQKALVDEKVLAIKSDVGSETDIDAAESFTAAGISSRDQQQGTE